ncbi:LysE/ArgO family amino acid transporter [Spartinivicinus sp. A2-2]|uniref:LysE/ArgO family amino acid transporter n=2 Tax=Spartinivicinus poritis TaxID=2994640 RepID=A0ABT5UFX8_9GAMM|nr:LysE/ArgO family amino acid transporter [Spartinivicinus sp. A2-2]MDE1465296.1 LysE/ArgO family amino acid transporter [Spartinivicinus sp. A2-2]
MIIPIGAQNAFVISQGIKRNYHLLAASICLLCDIGLIALGVFGSSGFVSEDDFLYQALTWGGAIFLLIYGTISLKKVIQPVANNMELSRDSNNLSLKLVIISALAVTLLNPHVYLDTVMILGGASLKYTGDEKIMFAIGCMLASVVWFYFLAILAARLAPWLLNQKVQKGIDFVIGVVMWFIAVTLIV